MDHSSWDWEAYGWCTREITQLYISLCQSGTFWAETVLTLRSNLHVWFSLTLQQTRQIQGHCHLSWFWNPPVSFCDVPAFHGDQTVAWVATTLYESRILGFTTEFLALPKNIFLLFGQLSSYVWALAAVSQAKLFRAFSSRTRVEELNSLSRTMDRLYPLFFKCPSSDAIAILLLLGFLVRNPHRVCF